MCLEIHKPVHDMHAGFFKAGRPPDIAALVKPRLQLEQDGHLLAGVCRRHQSLDERRLVADSIERHLDRDDLFVFDGGVEERLEGRERVERMVQQRIAVLDLLEDRFGILPVPDRPRHKWRILQFRTFDGGQRHPIGKTKARGGPHHDITVDLEIFDEDVEHAARHAGVDLQERRWPVPDVAQPLIDRLEKIDGFFLLQHDVGFPNDAEEMRVSDIHAGEEL